MKSTNYKLQFITHCNAYYSYVDSARMALEGGCRWIQLRMKDASEALLEETAITVQRMCREYGATFIIDDNVLLARRIGADGVHLGKEDMPIAQARRVLGEGFIIGATVNTFDDVISVMEGGGSNYFGCGPFRYTSTKKNLSPTLGYEGYRNITARMREHGIQIPLVAIGGITRSDVCELMRSGVSGIAISGGIINAADPVAEMCSMVNMFSVDSNL